MKLMLAALLITTGLQAQVIEAGSLFQPASLAGTWKRHTGDDPRWADPQFDDSGWESAKVPEAIVLPYAYRGWCRVRVRLTGPMPAEPLRVLIGPIGNGVAYEVFLNGRRAGALGDLSGGMWGLVTPRVASFPVEGHPRELLLAIRMYSEFIPFNSSARQEEGGIWVGTADGIGLLAEHWHGRRLRRAVPMLLTAAGVIMAGLFFVAMPLWRRDSPEYFWFGVFLLFGLLTRVPVVHQEVLGSPLAMTVCLAASFAAATLQLCWLRMNTKLFFAEAGMVSWLATAIPMGLAVGEVLGIGTLTFKAASLIHVTMAMAMAVTYYDMGWRRARQPFPMPGIHAAFVFFLLASLVAFFGNAFSITGTLFFQGQALRTFSGLVFAFAMAILLNQRSARLFAERRRIGDELAAAAEVQSLLLRSVSKSDGIDAVYLPAAEVGGDFYQVLEREDGCRVVLVGDVSGKGLKAAMLVSVVVGALRRETSSSPAAILAALNDVLVEQTGGGFVTCCCVCLQPDGGALAANAGHPAPYVDGREVELEAGLPLGLVHGVTYTESAIAGEAMCLVSDGVIEAANATGELFGFARTAAMAGKPAKEIAEAARAWGQNDDITVVTIRRATV